MRANRFDADANGVAELKNEIVGRLARTLKLALVQVERRRIEQESTGDLSARDLVIIGWARLNQEDPNRAETQRLFERALEMDPHSINAQLGLARVLIRQLNYPRTSAFRQIETRVENLLLEPLRVHGDQAQAHATMGFLRRVQNRLVDSRVELEMAIALDPNNSWAYNELGFTLIYLGEPRAALPYIEKAMRLNVSYPNIGFYYWGLGACHLLLGDLDQAIELLRKARAAANLQRFYIHEWLAGALGLKGEVAEARAALVEMMRIKIISLKEIRIHYPWTTNPRHSALRENTIDLGLRRAGLPEE